MRQTGRTTKMLVQMAVYITDNWNTPKFILLIADSTHYAWILVGRLSTFISDSQRIGNTIRFGKIKMLVINHQQEENIRGHEFDAVFIDHYDRRYEV